MRADVQLTGDKQLQRDLAMLASSSVNDVLRNPIRAGLQPIREEASSRYKALGWSDFAKKSNIKRKVNSGKKGLVGRVAIADITNRTVKLDGRDVPFNVVANILEFGSRSRNIREYRVLRGARDKKQAEALRIVQAKATKSLETRWRSGRLRLK